jgi:hypothetical protein
MALCLWLGLVILNTNPFTLDNLCVICFACMLLLCLVALFWCAGEFKSQLQSFGVTKHDLALCRLQMSGPTQYLPFLSASEEACLKDVASARIRGLTSPGVFFTLLLGSGSEFSGAVHRGLGEK